MPVDFNKLMDSVAAETKAHGMDFRGKKYSPVATRVELFRRAYGDTASITTDVLHLGLVKGDHVVIRASISLAGVVIATGTAGEVIGQGNVNQSSALENAETSAVGRALAVLGLHGGEMASANEMAAIDTKPANPSREALGEAWEDAATSNLADAHTPEDRAEAFAAQLLVEVPVYKTEDGLNGFVAKRKSQLGFIHVTLPQRYEEIRAAVVARRAEIAEAKAAKAAAKSAA